MKAARGPYASHAHPRTGAPRLWPTASSAELYVYHRVMSRYCHASVHVVDEYLELTDDGEDVQALRLHPKAGETDTWRYFLALAMLWAARAVDFIDPSRMHRSELRALSRELSVTSELRLTSAAQARMAMAERERRIEARDDLRAVGPAPASSEDLRPRVVCHTPACRTRCRYSRRGISRSYARTTARASCASCSA